MHALPVNTMPINWFDAVVVIVLLLGLNTGRKHGMSEELMGTLQWITIVVVGAFFYRPFGDMLALSSPVSHLFCYITMYVTLAIVTKICFGFFKKLIGGKLVGSDVFGGGEYYLGMVAGGIRFACILIAALAILNAPLYTAGDIAAQQAYQDKWYGSNFFPGIASVQTDVFKGSLVGSLIKKRASIILIASTRSENVVVTRAKDNLP
jgi:uncharacterized membrane protein required for colicin V production